jgi:hypothetical protein
MTPAPLLYLLGGGPHSVSGGDDGFAVVVRSASAAPPIELAFLPFGKKGQPPSAPEPFDLGTNVVPFCEAGLATLPDGSYAAVWTDLSADGDGLGVALRRLEVGVPPAGPPQHANVLTDFNQSDADLVWTGSELVVAWTDESDSFAFGDLKLRTFDAMLVPTSGEIDLAATPVAEGRVSLAAFDGSWAAAWRSFDAGLETLHVRAGIASWTVGPFLPGGQAERPALTNLDGTHLLAVFTEGDPQASSDGLLFAAVLDTAAPGPVVAVPIPSAGGDAQDHPSVVRVGSRAYVAWHEDPALGDPIGEEIWLKELVWDPIAAQLDISPAPIPLPREAVDQQGDQRAPTLAAVPLWPEGALATAWEAWGGIQGSKASLVELVPVPVLRQDMP